MPPVSSVPSLFIARPTSDSVFHMLEALLSWFSTDAQLALRPTAVRSPWSAPAVFEFGVVLGLLAQEAGQIVERVAKSVMAF